MPIGSGSASTYVAFGASGLDAVVEATDDKGLATLRRRTRGEPLICEPALSPSAAVHGVAVGKLPPDAVAVKAAMAVSLEHGPMMEHVAPQLVIELIAALIDFAAAEAWNAFAPDEPIAIRFEPGGLEVEGCVMGQAGEELGLALYHHKGSIEKVIALSREGRPEAARALPCTSVVVARDDSFAVEAVREMTGVPVAPLVFHMQRGRPAPASEQDVAALVAALRAVTALSEGGRQASGRTLDRTHRVVAHAARGLARPRGATPRPAFEGVGRNEPCPCGSGKKFKRCHMDAVEASLPVAPRAALQERDVRIVRDVLAFGARRFGTDAIARGVKDMVGERLVSRQLVDPLLAYTWSIDGKLLAAHFLDAQRARLDADDRRWIELQLASHLSVWEVLRVERGKGVDVVDLLSGERCFVHEVMGSETLAARDAILARVTVQDIAVFCGLHESPLGPAPADHVIASFRAGGLAHGDRGAAARLIELWHEQLLAAERKRTAPMTITNTDGHDVATVEDHFALAGGAFEPVFETLAAIEGVVVDERDRKGARLTFTRPGNALHAWWKNTIVGSARLTPARLVISTNSTERAEALA
ncbi:MAG TPA: SEC-C domain-containing protein, partial [Kofleriaceae bacterium]|nr:SEC-C domain-containing protein [Kofleriaceae bacterium]